MTGRTILLLASLVVLLAHVTGTMGALNAFLSLDIDPSKMIYLTLLPLVGLIGMYLLSDGR